MLQGWTGRARAGMLGHLIALTCVLTVAQAAEEPAKETPKAPKQDAREFVPQELRYERKPLPDDQNAFTLWQQAIGQMVTHEKPGLQDAYEAAIEPASPFPAGEPGELLAKWLDSNRETLELVDLGIALGKCQFPEVTGFDMQMPYLASIRQLARMKLIRAKMLAARVGDVEASQEIASIVHLGSMTRSSEDVLITYLVGMAVETIGLNGARWLAAQKDVSEQALKGLFGAIEPGTAPDEALVQTMRVEFGACFVTVINRAADDGVDLLALGGGEVDVKEVRKLLADCPKPFDKAATVRVAGEYFAALISDVRSPWPKGDHKVGEKMEQQIAEWRKELAPIGALLDDEEHWAVETLKRAELKQRLVKMENPIGKVLISLVMPALGRVSEKSFALRANREATRAILAIRIFQLRKGRLPDTLDELANENILPAVPTDPYADKPLRYSKEKRIVWSVGPDGKDDGGDGEPNVTRGKDYVFSVP